MSQVKLASRLSGLQESATLALNARAQAMSGSGKTVYNLTAGELATDTPAYIQTAVARKLHLNKYTPVAGLPELRAAIAEHACHFYGLDWIKPANVVVTAGAKPALYATLLALINSGDEVIVPVPGWTSYQPLIELAGGKPVEVPLSATYDLDPAALATKRTPRTKAVILNSPGNPTGAAFSQAALTQVASDLKGSDITVIADDIYSKLVYEDNLSLVPSAGFDDLIIINGFSKSQALTGWRIGYLIADQAVAKAATSLLSHITGNAPLPSQYAALAALERDDRPPAATLKNLREQRDLVHAKLQAAGIKHQTPAGAFYVFLDLRDLDDDSSAWCERLLAKTGVALVPGEVFAAPGFARLTFVTEREKLETALDLLVEFVQKGAKV